MAISISSVKLKIALITYIIAKNSEILLILAIFISGFISLYIDFGNSSIFLSNACLSFVEAASLIISISDCLSSYGILGLLIISVIFDSVTIGVIPAVI